MQDAMSQCREQMRFQPWDCSHIVTILQDPPILRMGNIFFIIIIIYLIFLNIVKIITISTLKFYY